jgi:5-methylcytosine-specific restriction endonuclease McrA
VTTEAAPRTPAAPDPDGAPRRSAISEELGRTRRRIAGLEAHAARLVAQAERQGVPEAEGFGSTVAWLIDLTGEPPYVCRAQVALARSLRHMPLTMEAFSSGRLSVSRVRLLAECRELAPDVFARDEVLLVDQAGRLSARVLPLALSHWRRLADPDGAAEAAERAFEHRRLHASVIWPGMVRLDGDLDPEGGAVVLDALASLSTPTREPDDARTPEQRRADALVEICRRHLDSGNFPLQGGERPHLRVTVDLATLLGEGLVDLEAGPITAEAVRRLGCDASVSRIVFGPDDEPLQVGRATRTVSSAMRRALDLRDRHCTHPGCDVPAPWCDAHHIVHWAKGGETRLDNLRLLCRRHHGREHDRHPYRRRE